MYVALVVRARIKDTLAEGIRAVRQRFRFCDGRILGFNYGFGKKKRGGSNGATDPFPSCRTITIVDK
jgi:hypothetical protein